MKTKILYDQGSAKIPEDGIIFQPPYFYGVTDGTSGIYLPQDGPWLVEGRTGGQFASHAIRCSIASALPRESLEKTFRRANVMIRKLIEGNNGLSFQEPDLLPSASFIVARFTEESIKIIQGGDSLAVWLWKNGTIGGTPNRAFDYETELLVTVAALMMKHKQDRQKMWEEFRPVLAKKRRETINTQEGFAVLNGQPEAEKFWQEFILCREEIALLILFSDGFVPLWWTQHENYLAHTVISLYQKRGLDAVLKATRFLAGQKKLLSHEDYAEATAIAIEF